MLEQDKLISQKEKLLFMNKTTVKERLFNFIKWEKPLRYVSVRTDFDLKNAYQLGNQFFCIATALAYAWDRKFTPVFPFLNEPGGNRAYNRDHVFFRVNSSETRKIEKVHFDMAWRYKKIPKFKEDILLVGPFCSWKYFHHRRDQILKIFAPSAIVLEYLHHKYGELIHRPNTVGVHVRTADAAVHKYIPFVGLRYFELAMEHFSSNNLFVICSDRINWCKKHFAEKFPDKKFVFVEGNTHVQDFFLLSMMKNLILSNSTFSWWAAYLNTHPTLKVCVPERWLSPEFQANLDDYYLPEWIRIPHDILKETYPEDMYLYDEKSQSLDNPST
jgi:hypothetical protein